MTADASSTSAPAPTTGASGYRAEIQGLRTLAAALVGVYHIWFDRVSGGVDVFFVVSGFLITGSLVGSLERTGSIRYGAQVTRIARRILPAAYTVLVISMLLSVVLLSRVYWDETFREIVAAALYVVNWSFAASSVDYLATDEFQSPVLQFWALSVQGQFYVVWPLLLVAVGLLARRSGLPARRLATWVIATVTALSFVYALVRVGQNQVTAYYDTFARVWEFGLGGLVALVLGRRSPVSTPPFTMPVRAAGALSALGLAMILGTGMMLDVSTSFPGWPALIPTGGAVLILVAGTCTTTVGGLRFLRWRPVEALGDLSYAFFLWQWTLLAFTKIHFDLERLTFWQGLGVMAGAVVAAVVTHRLVEQPFLRRRDAAPARPSSLEVLGAVAVIGALVTTSAILIPRDGRLDPDDIPGSGVLPQVLADRQPPPDSPTTDASGPESLSVRPGEIPVLPPPVPVAEDLFSVGDGPLVPDPAVARLDRPVLYEEGCHQTPLDSELIVCRYGELGGPVIAMVGGSHVAQWQTAMDVIAQRYGWEVQMMTKSGCRFARSSDLSESCAEWVDAAVELILEERPEVVFVLGTTASPPGERIEAGAPELWAELDAAGIGVVAVRDNPWFEVNPPECVLEHGAGAPECGRVKTENLLARNPLLDDPGIEHLTRIIDLTPWFCEDGFCPVVAGNVLMYRDRHHLTATYVLALAPVLELKLHGVLTRVDPDG